MNRYMFVGILTLLISLTYLILNQVVTFLSLFSAGGLLLFAGIKINALNQPIQPTTNPIAKIGE